ncbi:MAG: hypothetical protein HOD34_02555 [Candidatus Peribacter sp.]|nr:hypothetical protein [Candidatus Peribacter sp.]
MLKTLQKLSTLAFALCAIGFSGSAHAYLSPADVFTDLEVPGTENTDTEVAPAQQDISGGQSAKIGEPEPEAPPPVKASPVFFRSGEKIERSTLPEVDTKSNDSPFEEVPEVLIPTLPSNNNIDKESEALLEELQKEEEALEEGTAEPTQEEQAEEEVQRPAAPKKKSVAMALLDRMKFLGGGVILAGIAFAFFFKKKKKSGPAAAATESANPPIPAPEKTQQVEESSERLEHALEAMGETKEAPQAQEPTDDDAPLGFSETPLPGQEEKSQ